MNREIRHILTAGAAPLFLIFILYTIKIWEIGMDWNLSWMGVYPLESKGLLGIFTHPLIHSDFKHLITNTLPLFFLSWCLFYFYHELAAYLLLILWISCGVLLFFIGKTGWHVGASGIIYGMAFFLFFSGVFRRHIPLMAISLLVAFLYGGLVWHMLPFFTPQNTSWEGHLSGAVSGTICALIFRNKGPQRPDPFAHEDEEEETMDYYGEEELGEESSNIPTQQEKSEAAIKTTHEATPQASPRTNHDALFAPPVPVGADEEKKP